MGSEERVRAISNEVVHAHRLALPDGAPPLRPFLSHVACFLVQATFLRCPQWSSDGNAFKEVVERCAEMLALKDCPALEIIQLQISAHAHMFMQQMGLAAEEKAFQKRQDDIIRCILNIEVLDRREDNMAADKLHKLVVEYILEATIRMMEAVNDDELMVRDEISAALDSIFPRTGFLYWLHQSDVEKVSQIQEISCVIPGIRAYNRARGKSVSVSELPYIYFEKEAQDMEKRVEGTLGSVTERIAAYRKALSLHMESLGVHHVLMQRLRDELHYDLQLFAFLQDLQSVLHDVHLLMTKLMERFTEQLNILQATIGSQTCVPNDLVECGHRIENSSKDDVDKVLIIDAKEVSRIKNERIQLHGYCLMSVVRHGGLFLHGNPEMGLVQVGEKCYTFATADNLNEFAKSPKHFLSKLESMAVMIPQLINTLGLQREPKFAHLAIPNILELVNKHPAQLECSTQTGTHTLPEHQYDEETYLKRVAELASKQTHSTQTDATSHFHRDSSSQVWLPRDKSTQSLFGKGTTMPVRLKFFENLRGPPDSKFKPVDMWLDV